MAPGRKRGAKGAKMKSQLSLGDLVLAKVKGFPVWPAKISKPEDWRHVPDPKKYFVQFFGTEEIAFVAPTDIQAFTSESKNKLSARCQGKTVKYFAQAVKEICEEFEELQRKKLSGSRDYSNAENLASETHSVDPVINEASEVSIKNGRDGEGPNCKVEAKDPIDSEPRSEHCSEKGEMDGRPVKPCLSDDISSSSFSQLSSDERNKLSTNFACLVKETNGDQSVLTNGHQPKLAMEDAKCRNNDLVISREHYEDLVQAKHASVGNMKVSSADNSRSDLGIAGERNGKKLLKGKKQSAAADDGQIDAEVISEDNNEVISRKKMKFQHDQEKQTSWTNEVSHPPTIDGREGKRLTSSRKAVHQPVIAQPSTKESKHSPYDDNLPPTKCQRRALVVTSNSTSFSENRSSNSSRNNNLVHPNKVQSPIMHLPAKRRAVCLRDDDEVDELPKTPVHAGSVQKVSVIPRVSYSEKKNVKREETRGHMVVRNTGKLADEFKDQMQSSQISSKTLSITAQQSTEKSTLEKATKRASPRPPRLDTEKTPFMEAKQSTEKSTLEKAAKRASPRPPRLDTEKTPFMEAKPVAVCPERSPRSITSTRPLAESRKKQLSEAHGSIYQKKVPSGTSSGMFSNRLNSSLNQSATERSRPTPSAEKKKATPRPEPQNDESITSHGERLDGGKASKTNLFVDLTISDSAMSMKNLIAAAQERKRQSNLHNSYENPLRLLIPDTDIHGQSPSPNSAALAVESRNTVQFDVQAHHTAPSFDVHQLLSCNGNENENLEERRANSGYQTTGSSLSGGTEAAVARDSFEGMIETLSRTKESIGRATRLAIDCAKYGIANEVVELLIRKLENEPSLHRKVDLFFLVDSITQCSHSQKGIAEASYIPTVQAALPLLIVAAAPPGAGAEENRRQCRKVLRLWLERKILPESVVRHYIDDLGATNDGLSAGFSQRRPLRAERAIDDPIREMEGMLVDEYGSNTTFQLPGFLPSHLFEEEEEEEEEDDNFPSKCKQVLGMSRSEHTLANTNPENCTVAASDRHHCILEDVDGELEMEDVSGHDKDERILISNSTSRAVLLEPTADVKFQSASHTCELLPSTEGSPPYPPGSPPVSPPPPTSPPPSSPSPPLPPPLPSSSPLPPPPPPPTSSQQLIPPPPVAPPFRQSLPPPPTLISQHMPTSQPFACHPPALHHEIGGTPSGNPPAPMISSTQGSHTDGSRGEIYSQQPSFSAPAAGLNARENVGLSSSRPVEYGQKDACINHQASQQRQQLMPVTAPFAQRPLHAEAPPQPIPNHFSYPNSVMQHQYPPYSLPVFPDGPSRYSTDEQWLMPVNDFTADVPCGGWNSGGQSFSGQPYSHEACYFGPPSGRAPASTISFRPSAANGLPPAGPISVHGVPMMPCRPDMPAVNWRPV